MVSRLCVHDVVPVTVIQFPSSIFISTLRTDPSVSEDVPEISRMPSRLAPSDGDVMDDVGGSLMGMTGAWGIAETEFENVPSAISFVALIL